MKIKTETKLKIRDIVGYTAIGLVAIAVLAYGIYLLFSFIPQNGAAWMEVNDYGIGFNR